MLGGRKWTSKLVEEIEMVVSAPELVNWGIFGGSDKSVYSFIPGEYLISATKTTMDPCHSGF